MPKLDLKAAAAARREITKADPPTITFPDGSEHTLPVEPSIEVAETLMHLAALDEADTSGRAMELMVQLGRQMLGEELYTAFLTSGATLQDLMALGGGFSELYPLGTSGESPASDDLSSNNSSRSRRTGKGTTTATSA